MTLRCAAGAAVLVAATSGAAGAVALLTGPAAAATRVSVSPGTVPADEVVVLTLQVPLAGDGDTNRSVEVLVPAGFAVNGCDVPSGLWSCTVDPDGRSPSSVVRWDNALGGSSADVAFELTVSTPSADGAGEHLLPVVQVLTDGREVRWSGSGATPAPRLTVTAPATSAVPAATASSASAPAVGGGFGPGDGPAVFGPSSAPPEGPDVEVPVVAPAPRESVPPGMLAGPAPAAGPPVTGDGATTATWPGLLAALGSVLLAAGAARWALPPSATGTGLGSARGERPEGP